MFFNIPHPALLVAFIDLIAHHLQLLKPPLGERRSAQLQEEAESVL